MMLLEKLGLHQLQGARPKTVQKIDLSESLLECYEEAIKALGYSPTQPRGQGKEVTQKD